MLKDLFFFLFEKASDAMWWINCIFAFAVGIIFMIKLNPVMGLIFWSWSVACMANAKIDDVKNKLKI